MGGGVRTGPSEEASLLGPGVEDGSVPVSLRTSVLYFRVGTTRTSPHFASVTTSPGNPDVRVGSSRDRPIVRPAVPRGPGLGSEVGLRLTRGPRVGLCADPGLQNLCPILSCSIFSYTSVGWWRVGPGGGEEGVVAPVGAVTVTGSR